MNFLKNTSCPFDFLMRFEEAGKNLSLLILRLVLAYGFFEPALTKWRDINAVGDWFASMNYLLPYLNAYLAAGVEALGVVLLVLGLFTRQISALLMVVMLVAITTVHLANGFDAGNNGFEIPFYYFVMLFVLLTHGPGKYSVEKILRQE